LCGVAGEGVAWPCVSTDVRRAIRSAWTAAEMESPLPSASTIYDVKKGKIIIKIENSQGKHVWQTFRRLQFR